MNLLPSCISDWRANPTSISYVTVTNYGTLNYYNTTKIVIGASSSLINAQGLMSINLLIKGGSFIASGSGNLQLSANSATQPFINQGSFVVSVTGVSHLS